MELATDPKLEGKFHQHEVISRRAAVKLNEKGQCPFCRKKPLTYKRDKYYFCCRCDRAFDWDTQEQIRNWAWDLDENGNWKSGHFPENRKPSNG